uniref:Uncharacterized protein n=1 Tax=Anabas testudineus TaxID=64144 RepID=A0A3Q1HSY9_ANATE
MVQEVDKGGVHTYFKQQGHDVRPPQASALLASVRVESATVFTVLESVFPFPVFPVRHVHNHHRVAAEVFLFVTPYLLCCHHIHHDPEEENNREPHSAKSCGVFVHPAEETLEECPVHDVVCSARLLFLPQGIKEANFTTDM